MGPEPIGVCERTPEVRDAILLEVYGVTRCEDITAEDLARISTLGVFHLAELREGDFAGMTWLTYLFVVESRFTSLPEGVFTGLTNLRELNLSENQLASLPEGVFSGLANLEWLWLTGNRLTSLPEGVFAGLVSLEALSLGANPGAPFELPLRFERTDAADTAGSPASVRLVLARGAPFNMAVPLAIQGGTASSASAVLSTGSIEGQVFTVTQASPGQSTRVQASGIPTIPEEIRGIVLLAPEDIVLFSNGGD